MEQIIFKKRSQYGLYLRHILSQSLKQDSFNIFLHCVTNAYPRTATSTEKEDVLGKVNEIIKEGLDLEGCHERCPYGSISGTARFMGEFQNVNIEDIIDYDFTRNSRYINTIILAIPKYISLPTGRQEFSSFNGHMDYFNRFRKTCLLDISKERYLPTEFTFGYQLVDRQTGEVKFWQNDRYFSQLTKEDQDEIMQGFAKRIEAVFDDCKTNHNAASIKEVFEIMTNRHMSLLDDYFNDI